MQESYLARPTNRVGRAKRRPVPQGVRKRIARRYGIAEPGESTLARCWYCDDPGLILWDHPTPKHRSGFVHLQGTGRSIGLEFDHVIPSTWASDPAASRRVIIACASCNARRCDRYTVSEFWRLTRGTTA